VTDRLVHHQVDAAASSGVRNSQPEGIGRVVTLGDLVCWNNLGRNVVFADPWLRPLAIFGTTVFPDDDEASQYDLDVHAILDVPESELIVVLNHFGTVRGFRRRDLLGSTGGWLVAPSAVWSFVADVERTIAVAGRLVGTVPRAEGAVGLIVSELLHAIPDRATVPTTVGGTCFGEITALAAVPSPDDPLVAVGGDGKVALMQLTGARVEPARWEARIDFRAATIASSGDALWAAGPARGGDIDDYDWEQLRGGGFAVLDPTDGGVITSGALPDDVAWGTGGVAVARLGPWLATAGRRGCLYLIDPRTGLSHRAAGPLAGGSLGIAHLSVADRRVLCGFNRGGYRLHSFAEPAAAVEVPYSLSDW
jgi:hypothetical protein